MAAGRVVGLTVEERVASRRFLIETCVAFELNVGRVGM